MKPKPSSLAAFAAAALFFGVCLAARAQWLTQNITVGEGWTAAYLFVDASSQTNLLPATAGQPISAGNPIDQIWMWQVPAGVAQYVSTPRSPLGAGGRWLSWSVTNTQNTLSGLDGNAAYLIHSSAAYVWSVQGQPVPPQYTWDTTGLNFIGFSTPAVNPPTFQSFLSQDPAIANIVQVYQYVGGDFSMQPPNLNPAPVTSFRTTPVNRGQAYWLGSSNVNNTYFGPFQVHLPDPAGLLYGASAGQLTVHLVNNTASPLTISMYLLPSETAPAGQTPIAGPPPLLVEGSLNSSNLTYAYTPVNLNGGVTSWTLPPFGQPGSDLAVVLGVNRFAMSGASGSSYAGILQFTDSLGFSQLNVPVSATVTGDSGLWVGSASVSQVSYDLKTYETNASGALEQVTNYVTTLVTNSAATLGLATNVLIKYSITDNVITTDYTVTNQEIDTYTSSANEVTTTGFVPATNLVVTLGFITNTIITTTETIIPSGSGGITLLIQNVTNTTVTASPPSASFVVVTNQIAPVPTNGALVTVTNFTYTNYVIESLLITNAPFFPSVTNLETNYTYTATNSNFSTSLSAAFNGVVTNVTTTVASVTNAPVTTNYSTITTNVAVSATTNFFRGPFLLVETNSGSLVSVAVVSNCYFTTNFATVYNATNSMVVSNAYAAFSNASNLVASATNLVFTSTSPPSIVGQSSTNYTNLVPAVATIPYVAVVSTGVITSVSNYVVLAHNTNLDSVVTPYPLRLIVFSGTNGGAAGCSLLQRVYYGLDPGTNLILATGEGALNPASLNTARRITATHLPWSPVNTPWAFSGGLLAPGGTYTTTIIEPYDDQAANPFLHTYHPDHNNLDNGSPAHELPVGSQSYEIDRTITLSPAASGNDFLSLTTANSSLSGYYNETISLIGATATKSYQTAGIFTLRRISPISTLITP